MDVEFGSSVRAVCVLEQVSYGTVYCAGCAAATRELDVPTVPSDTVDDTTTPPAHVPAVAACAVAIEDTSAPLLTPTARAYMDGACDVAGMAAAPTYTDPHGSTSGADPSVTVEVEALAHFPSSDSGNTRVQTHLYKALQLYAPDHTSWAFLISHPETAKKSKDQTSW